MTVDDSERLPPFPPEPSGHEVVQALLRAIEDDERLSASIGVDLTPAAPAPSASQPSDLESWLRRAEEVHRFLEECRRAEHAARAR